MKFRARKKERERLDILDVEEYPEAVLYQAARSKFVASMLSEDDLVVDIACGLGFTTAFIAPYCSYVIGVDIDQTAIDECVCRYKHIGNIEWKVGDAEWENLFMSYYGIGRVDAVVSLDTIEHLKDREGFVARCSEALPSGGIFICGSPRKQDIPVRNAQHEHEYEPDEFYELLERHFSRVLRFSMLDEIVGTFNPNLAWYLFGVCVK